MAGGDNGTEGKSTINHKSGNRTRRTRPSRLSAMFRNILRLTLTMTATEKLRCSQRTSIYHRGLRTGDTKTARPSRLTLVRST